MTEQDPMLRCAVDLVRECHAFMQGHDIDLARAAECASSLDQTCSKIDQMAEICRASVAVWVETAAWCRLAAGLLRGEDEDVPESIHVPDDEAPKTRLVARNGGSPN